LLQKATAVHERRRLQLLQRFPAHRHPMILGALARSRASGGRGGDARRHAVGRLTAPEYEAVLEHETEQALASSAEDQEHHLLYRQLVKEEKQGLEKAFEEERNRTHLGFLNVEVDDDDDHIGQQGCGEGEVENCKSHEDDHNNQAEEHLEGRALGLLEKTTGDPSMVVEGQVIRAAVDDVPRLGLPAGWDCAVEMYGDGEVCDCNCGIWDPDCDTKGAKHTAFAIADKEQDDIELLDELQVGEILNRLDKSGNGIIDGTEPWHRAVLGVSALDGLVSRIVRAETQSTWRSAARFGNFAQLLAVETASCNLDTSMREVPLEDDVATYTPVCVKDTAFRPRLREDAGRCELLPTMRPGSQCTVPGDREVQLSVCENFRGCVASASNTWDYTCTEESPLGNSTA